MVLSGVKDHQIPSETGRVNVAKRVNVGNFRLLGSRTVGEEVDVVVVIDTMSGSSVLLSDYSSKSPPQVIINNHPIYTLYCLDLIYFLP